MTSGLPVAIGTFPRFCALLAGLAALLLLVGYAPTRSLGGGEAIPAMLLGCGVSLFASLAGGAVAAWAGRSPARKRGHLMLASMGLRLLLVLALALAIALAVPVDRQAFLLWVALSYCGFLAVDVAYAIRQV